MSNLVLIVGLISKLNVYFVYYKIFAIIYVHAFNNFDTVIVYKSC